MPTDALLPAADLERIEAAVHEAEKDSAGEIVPYIVARSDPYEEAPWKGAAWSLLVAALALGATRAWSGGWGPSAAPLWDALLVAAAGAGGWLAGRFISPLTRLLVGSHVLDLRVRRRAAVAFVEAEVFRTAARTGILLLISVFERRVVILGDRGINDKVEDEEWQEVVGLITAGLKSDRPADAIVRGIHALGDLLRASGVTSPEQERDELADRPRIDGGGR